MEKTPMTVDGEKILRLELERLKTEERPRIVQAISEAREQGDLRENAEYQYAKEEQGFIEGRILDIEAKLANANVIDVNQITPTANCTAGYYCTGNSSVARQHECPQGSFCVGGSSTHILCSRHIKPLVLITTKVH